MDTNKPISRNPLHAEIMKALGPEIAKTIGGLLAAAQATIPGCPRIALAVALLPEGSNEACVCGNIKPAMLAYVLECGKVGLIRMVALTDPALAAEIVKELADVAPKVDAHTFVTLDPPRA